MRKTVKSLNVLKYFLLVTGLLVAIEYPIVAISEPSAVTSNDSGSSDEIPLKDIRHFTNVIAIIKNNYVEPIQDNKLFDNAIRGFLSNLDPYSHYLNQEEIKHQDVEANSQVAGIGVELATDEHGEVRVVAPFDDSPAAKAGIKSEDILLKIDHHVVTNMSLIEATKRIQGKKGTTVALELLRPQAKKIIKLNVVRDNEKTDAIKSKLIEQSYGYIRIPRFNENAVNDVLKATDSLKQQAHNKLKGLILDIRNNTGGSLDSAVKVTDLFLDVDKLKSNKKIVYTRGREPSDKIEINATKKDVTGGVPLAVLINHGSASSSEVMAGALQDHQRAVILGTQSFGKGSMQTTLPIDDKSSISLTTALYYTPLGRPIQGKGIKPDVQIEDVKIAPIDPDQEGFSYREEDLAGHFHNAQNKEAAMIKNKGTEQNLAETDFQLYSALNLLKGMKTLKK